MGSSAYKAARDTAYNSEWIVGKEYSADKELYDANTLITLRQRSRQFIKDNPVVAGMQQGFINSIGSPNNVKCESKTELKRKAVQERLDEFVKNCTLKRDNLKSVIDTMTGSAFSDGDVLVSLPLDKKREVGKQTVIELIEAQRIRTPTPYKNKNNVRNGVKYDDAGRVLGYYVKKASHMDMRTEMESDFTFYPVEKSAGGKSRVVTRLFKAPLHARPSISRQYPMITPAMTIIKHIDDYIEAVIVGARVSACFAAFISSQNPTRAWDSMTTDSAGTMTDPQDGNASRRVTKLFPGMVSYLRQNESISFASPNKPSDNQDAFIVRLYKTISMLMRVPYEILFLDLSEVNYSSWRGGANERKNLLHRWRTQYDDFLMWILETVVNEAVVFNQIRSTGKYSIKIRWPSFSILDPEKEGRANSIELKNETKSQQRICEERGESYDEIQEEITQHLLNKVDRVAAVLVYIKEKEEEFEIEIPLNAVLEGVNPPSEGSDTRPGEGNVVDAEEKKARRKDAGNW